MSPDEYQQAWQAQSSQTRVTIDVDILLKEVQRSQQNFRATILLRDFREAGTSILMIPLWFFLGSLFTPVWSWYLTVPALIWVSGFIIVDRIRHKQKLSEPGASLLDSVRESLTQVEHQIWLLRNVLWWYLMPFAIPILIFFAHTSWSLSGNWLLTLFTMTMPSLLVLALYGFIYYLNQYAVRTQLEPRRQELLALLASLRDETGNGVGGDYPILTSAACVKASSLRRMIIATLCAIVLIGIGIAGIAVFSKRDDGHPKLAPFTDVRWDRDVPVVEIDGAWHLLFSIDKIPVKDIVEFCQRTYGDKWQKRFAEDLVQVMTEMGHKPGDSVKLDVMSTEIPVARTTMDRAMTAANRRAVKDAADKRERSEEQSEKLRADARDEPVVPLAELVPSLRKENKLVGLAAMVMVHGKVVVSAVDGERKVRSGVALTIGDQWHLGSITKSITATMIARLVEQGKMKWTDTVGACFPDAPIHEDWKPVTLRQLLTHTAGAPANFALSVRMKDPELGPECTQARKEAVLELMAATPEYKPGTQHAYSNVGYTIAGAMAEQATGETWDTLVKREVYTPLGLTSAGFGPPKSVGNTLEQPQGHIPAFFWKVGAGEDADNTFIMGPAGIAHMSLEDLCNYATEHLRGERGEGKLLSAETYKLLHTPELDNYACGWVLKEASIKIPHTVFWHNGSNTMWYALVVFIPETNMVVGVASNDGDIAHAESAAWRIVENSVRENAGAESGSQNP